MEAKLQKLKVAELKELLAKHHLVQTGKKDDLIKRLLDNNVAVDEPVEELVDVDGPEIAADAVPVLTPAPQAVAVPTVPAPSTETSSTAPEPTSAKDAEGASAETATPAELTPEQQAMKARAERFGIPFNPNPTPKNRAAKPTKAAAEAAPTKPAEPKVTEKVKAGAIDSNPLGLSEEVLARRAAKFGLPEKKEKEEAAPAPAPASAPAAAKPKSEVKEQKKEEISPELAEKLAIEEEKKRKRAEKFGTVKPAAASNGTGNGDAEPDAKKVKV